MERATLTYKGREYTVDNVDGLSNEEIVQKARDQHNAAWLSIGIKGNAAAALNGASLGFGKKLWGGSKYRLAGQSGKI
ncbi:hypothetical protein AGMMS49950_10240 [Endomicrobiia bacterium]|nr:hypothetical protein AGMMS49950_10240 [Endomicrobiia bacterium]